MGSGSCSFYVMVLTSRLPRVLGLLYFHDDGYEMTGWSALDFCFLCVGLVDSI
jgi:hypothetical protein